jgi:TonB family protein
VRGVQSISRIERPRTGLFVTICLSALIHVVLFGLLGYYVAEKKETVVIFSPPYSVSLLSSETPGEGGEGGTEPAESHLDSSLVPPSSTEKTVTVPEEKKETKKEEAKKEEKKVTPPEKTTETTGDLTSAIEKIRKKVETQEEKKRQEREAQEKARKAKELAEAPPAKAGETPSGPSGTKGGGTEAPKPGTPGGGNPYGYDNVFTAGGTGRGVPDPEFSAYYSEIWKRIRALWSVPDDLKDQGLVVVYGIRIARDGRVLDVWLENGSGSGRFDDTALRAIKKADPLPPLPPKYADSTIEVGIRFHSD